MPILPRLLKNTHPRSSKDEKPLLPILEHNFYISVVLFPHQFEFVQVVTWSVEQLGSQQQNTSQAVLISHEHAPRSILKLVIVGEVDVFMDI